jgi:phosphate uptake regulator
MRFLEMFKSWRGEGVLDQTLDSFLQMLDDGQWMFSVATDALWTSGWNDDVKTQIYERDIRINKAERSNRKKIVEHLSIDPGRDTNYCLVLMSVMKDAERVGDYCKNLFEVSQYHPTQNDQNAYRESFMAIHIDITGMFANIGTCFRESDEVIGRELVEKEVEVSKKCDALIETLLDSTDLEVRPAVCYSLLARYYKRISAHLGNIASSVVLPLHKMDYYDEKTLKGTPPTDEFDA